MELAIAIGVLAPTLYFDFREMRIPDFLTLPGIAALIVWRIAAGRFSPWDLAAAAAGFGAIAALCLLSKGRIGLGDAKLSAFLALLLGFGGWVWGMFLASLTGILFVLAMMGLGRMTGRERIPFAPFLVAGAAVSFFTAGPVLHRVGIFL